MAVAVVLTLLGMASLAVGDPLDPAVGEAVVGPGGTVVVGTTPGTVVVTPTGPPRVSVEPGDDLVDGQRVAVTATGIGQAVLLLQCGPGAALDACDPSSVVRGYPDAAGEVTATVVVGAQLQFEGTTIDCREPGAGCRLVVFGWDVSTQDVLAETSLDFRPDGPLSPPTLTATPSTGLADRQTVHLAGDGFAPNRSTVVVLCAAGARTVAECDTSSALTAELPVDAEGRFAADVPVPTVSYTGTFDRRDCRVVACELAVYQVRTGYEILGTPISFAPDAAPTPVPEATVVPSTALVDRQVVDLRATGFAPRAYVSLYECGGGTCRGLAGLQADEAGTVASRGSVYAAFTAQYTMDGPPPPTVDCRVSPCQLVLVSYGATTTISAAALDFDPDAPLAPPPTVTIEPSTDLVDGQTVTVTGEGFVSSDDWSSSSSTGGVPQLGYVSLATCVGDGMDRCGRYTGAVLDGDGRLATPYQVSAVVRIGDERIDCRTAVPRCRLVVGLSYDPMMRTSVELDLDPDGPLLPPPELTVTPAGDVHDGDNVTVRVSGLRQHDDVWVAQCEAGADATRPTACAGRLGLRAGVDGVAEGAVMIDAALQLQHYGEPERTVDCAAAPGRCELLVMVSSDGSSDGTVLRSPLTITPNPDAERYRDRVFSTVTISPDHVYGRAPAEDGTMQDLHLDIYEPEGDTARDRPVVLYAHGGYFAFGDKSEGATVGRELAKRGYVVVSVQYRLFPQRGDEIARYAKALPAAQHDVQAAVRWVRSQAEARGWSTEKIGVMGYSAGAVTSLHVAYRSFDPGDSGNPGYRSDVRGAISLAGAAVVVTPGSPPVLMIHGEMDSVVPFVWADKTCRETIAIGNRCTMVSYPGVDHGIQARYADWLPRAVEFLASEVVAPAPPPPTTVPPSTTPEDPAGEVPVTPGPQVLGTSVAQPVVATPDFTG